MSAAKGRARQPKEPRWITPEVLHLLHDRQLELFGGLAGIGDENAIRSALERPRSHWHYGGVRDLFELAAVYLSGLAQQQGDLDGNKRAAVAAMGTFLSINGRPLTKPGGELYAVTMAAATNAIDVRGVSEWLHGESPPP